MNETTGQKLRATELLRRKAKLIHDEARKMMRRADGLLSLANAIDSIERNALSLSKSGEDSSSPYIGAGSGAEFALIDLIESIEVPLS